MSVITRILSYSSVKSPYIEFFESNAAFDKLNRAGCCVGNTAGYGVLPQAVSPAAPGFARIGAFSNPCMPMN